MRFLRPTSAGRRPHYGIQSIEDVPFESAPDTRRLTFQNYSLAEFVRAVGARRRMAAMQELAERYGGRRVFPDMSNFRLGPNMFGDTALDWIAFSSEPKKDQPSRLLAHGITTRIRWSGDPSTLPRGWTGAVRQSYEDAIVGEVRPDTLVGLFIFAENASREQGWAANVAREMKRIAVASGLRDLIIPLRLPTRYERANALAPYEEFALRRREDGQYSDHWLRMHARLGAEVIGVNAFSHQHALHPDDLLRQVRCEPLGRSGSYIVRWNDEYHVAIVDIENGYAVINQGCVWVRHAL